MNLIKKIFGKKVAEHLIPSRESQFNALLNEALAEMNALNQRAIEHHGFGTFDRWDLTQEEGILRFSDEAGRVRISSPVTLAGTYSLNTHSFMWGWANKSLLPHLTADLARVRNFGTENSYTDLTASTLQCNEAEAWAMAAIALKIIGGEGVYRGPSGSGYTFIIMKDITSGEKLGGK